MVTLSNTGTVLLSISNILFENGDRTVFNQTNNCGSSVPPGANCQISVTYSPQVAQTTFADLMIFDNASGSPQSVVVNGTAVAPITPSGNYPINVIGTYGVAEGAYSRATQFTMTVQ